MTVETEIRSRRSLLAGGLAGAAAMALAADGRPARVEAANGDTMKVGQAHSASALTSVNSSSNGFKGSATGAGGVGVVGQTSSATGFGVSGFSSATSGTPVGVRGTAAGNGIGVLGIAARGVMGESKGTSGFGVVAKSSALTGTGNGLRALAFAPGAEAIYAENSANGGAGHALHAKASTTTTVRVENVSGLADGVGVASTALGIGVEGHGRIAVFGEALAGSTGSMVAGVRGVADDANHYGGSFLNQNTSGWALQASGGVRFQGAAGTSTVAATQSSVVVTPNAPLRSGTLILATLQSDPGNGRTVARVAKGSTTFTIFLTGAVTDSCEVGWFVVN